MEKPVIFKSREEESLFGMFFSPEKELPNKVGILICPSSIKYRIGPFRIHTLLARYLCDLGYFVMYFDPSGFGDSEGDFETKRLTAHHLEIQNGKLTKNIIDAANRFTKEFKLDNLILFGICGGAISALVSASSDQRVGGLILLAVPVLYDIDEIKGEVFDEISVITSEVQSAQIISNLVCKLLQFQTWKKIFALKIAWRYELGVIFKAIMVLVLKIFFKIKKRIVNNESGGDLDTPVSNHPRFNFLFQKSFVEFMARGKQVLFLFADNDFVTWVFKSEFQDMVLCPGNRYEAGYQINIIKDANHIFSGRDTQVELRRIISKWLHNNYRNDEQ